MCLLVLIVDFGPPALELALLSSHNCVQDAGWALNNPLPPMRPAAGSWNPPPLTGVLCCLEHNVFFVSTRSNPSGGPQGELGFCCALLAVTLLRWSTSSSMVCMNSTPVKPAAGPTLGRGDCVYFFAVYQGCRRSTGIGDCPWNRSYLKSSALRTSMEMQAFARPV